MRKRLKNKRRSCGACKAHKRGLAHRWKADELMALEDFEKTRQKAKHGHMEVGHGQE